MAKLIGRQAVLVTALVLSSQGPGAIGQTTNREDRAAESTELNERTHRLAEAVHVLGQVIANRLDPTPMMRDLVDDAQELEEAVNEFHETLRGEPSRMETLRAYEGIDVTWHHLRAQIGGSAFANPAVVNAARRVDEADTQIHRALGLKPYSWGLQGRETALSGYGTLQRLTHALDDRARALVAAAQAGRSRDSQGEQLAREAATLRQSVTNFHLALDLVEPGERMDIIRNGYMGVSMAANRLGGSVLNLPEIDPVKQAWYSVAATDSLIRRKLDISAPPGPGAVVRLDGSGRSRLETLAGQLVEEVDAYRNSITPLAGTLPQGSFLLDDVRRLRQAVEGYRRSAEQNLGPEALAYEFRMVDAHWHHLARQINRLARRRPELRNTRAIAVGECFEQMHRMLGIPGYPPLMTSSAVQETPTP